jgi:hypothetical protein
MGQVVEMLEMYWVDPVGGIAVQVNIPYPNNEACQNGNISNTGNSITNIGSAGNDAYLLHTPS